jgi:hypothetical protein
MHPWVQKMVRHVQSTPPSCLSGFRVTPAHAGPWNDWAAWALTCACGSSRGKLLGHPFNNGRGNESLFVSPLAFQCSSCGKTTEIIDTKRHGYNAEIDKMEGKSYDFNARGTGERQAVPCPSCGGLDFSLTALCAHSHFELIEDQPELEPLAQEFFDSFICRGKCGSCGKESNLAGFELA